MRSGSQKTLCIRLSGHQSHLSDSGLAICLLTPPYTLTLLPPQPVSAPPWCFGQPGHVSLREHHSSFESTVVSLPYPLLLSGAIILTALGRLSIFSQALEYRSEIAPQHPARGAARNREEHPSPGLGVRDIRSRGSRPGLTLCRPGGASCGAAERRQITAGAAGTLTALPSPPPLSAG